MCESYYFEGEKNYEEDHAVCPGPLPVFHDFRHGVCRNCGSVKTCGGVSRGLVVNVEFIRQLGPKSCILKDGREILLSRSNTEEIHSAYAEYVFSQLSERDGASPDGMKQS